MRIGIVGSGSLGSVLGGLLIEAGYNVIMMERNESEVSLVSEMGYRLDGVSGDRNLKPDIVGLNGVIPTVDVAILVVKSYDTGEAVKTLGRLIGDEGIVLTLQNGVGNFEIIEEAFPGRVLLGTTTMGAMTMGPGWFRHTGLGATTFGEPDGSIKQRTLSIKEVLEKMNGGPVSVVDNAMGCVWSKLIVNAAINAPATLLRLRNGDLPKSRYGQSLIHKIVNECLAVVEAKKIRLVFDNPEGHVLDVCRGTAQNVNSMFQDILAGRKTEIDFINGAISAQAQTLGLSAPVNQTLALMIGMLEESRDLTVAV